MFGRPVHQIIQSTCLLMAAFFMPVSVWMLSAVSIALAVNWLAGGDYRAKVKNLSGRGGILILLLLFAMYLLWLLNTSDFNGALHELNLRLSLLLFPVVIGSSSGYSDSQLRMLFLAFISGCAISVGAGFMALSGMLPVELNDSRDLALFVPSIRLSLLLNFAIFTAVWMSLDNRSGNMVLRTSLALAAAMMAFFLFRLLSVTGIIIFIILLCGTGLHLTLKLKKPLPGITFLVLSAVAIITSVILVSGVWTSLRYPSDPGINEPRLCTLSGNHYTHFPEETLIENGYFVWMNVCEDELRDEWSMRSEMPYEGIDKAGNELRVTLIRYITYLGMTKDSAAVASLTSDDIRNIEKGFAIPLYARIGSPRAKAYEIAWQIDKALKNSNPSGHSVTQRLEFYRASVGIIRKHPWFGTGTGDVRNAFSEEYSINNTPLTESFRKISHNQYLGFAVTFGIPGMMVALALMLLPWLRSPNRLLYPFVIFMSIIFMSMFNDDTFSSNIGTTFFSYFYTLLLIFKRQDGTG